MDLFAVFGDLIQPFDAPAAAWFGPIMARRGSLGLPMEGFDAQIAAICRTGVLPWRRGTSRISGKPG